MPWLSPGLSPQGRRIRHGCGPAHDSLSRAEGMVSGTIELPVWLVGILAALALVGLLDRLLIPSVRFLLRRRLNAAIAELNSRLRLRIQPFKLTRRQSLIDRLMFDPELVRAAEAHAVATGEPRAVVMARVETYAREIVPNFSAYAYFKFGTQAARLLSTLLYRVRLGYMDDETLRAVDPDAAVVFVPVGIKYDRVLKDRNLTASAAKDAGAPYAKLGAMALLRYVVRAAALAAIGRWYRNGYAAASFGTPVSLRAHTRERGLDFRKLTEQRRFTEVEALGTMLMREVGKLVPVLPVSLVASVLMRANGRELSEAEIESGALALIEQVRTQGAHVHVPRQDMSYAVRVGLRMLELRRIVEASNGKYRANPREIVLLRYYANAIAQHFACEP